MDGETMKRKFTSVIAVTLKSSTHVKLVKYLLRVSWLGCVLAAALPSAAQAQQAGRATLSDGTMIVEGSLDGSVISSSPIVGAGDSNIAVPLGLTGSYFWLQRQEGEGPGFRNTHRTTLAGFVPIQLSDVNILFLDGRVSWVNGNELVYNGGIGFRHYVPAHDRFCGISLWYDIDDSRDPQRFEQFGLSFESRGENWDFFANYYEPTENERQYQSTEVALRLIDNSTRSFQNNFIVVNNVYARSTTTTFENSMKGFDLEFGGPVPFIGKSRDVRGYFGFYRFENDNIRDLNGASLRINANVGGLLGNINAVGRAMTWDALDEMRAQFMLTHDQEFSTSVMFSIAFNMPGGASPSTRNRMREPVKRNMQVVIVEDKERFDDTLTLGVPLRNQNGQLIIVRHADSTAPALGDGTFESPFNNLADLEANSLPRDILLAHADSVFAGEMITLQVRQRFLGEGPFATHFVDTFNLGTVMIPLANPAGVAQPVILNSPGNAVELANFSEVSGFTIDLAAGAGIFADGVSGNVDVNQMDIMNSARGVEIRNSSGTFAFDSVDIAGSTGSGVLFDNNTGITTYMGGSITGSGGSAVDINGGVPIVDFINPNITNAAGRVIDINGTALGSVVTFTGGSISDNGGTGALFSGIDGEVAVNSPLTIANSTSTGVDIQGGTGIIGFGDLSITNAAGTGFNVDGGSARVNVAVNNFTNTNGFVLAVQNTMPVSDVRFTGGGSITDTGGQGMLFNNVDGVVTLAGLTTNINNSTTNGILIQNQSLSGLLNLSDMTINNSADAGILLSGNSGTVNIGDIMITNSMDEGVNVFNNNADFIANFTNLTITGATGSAVEYDFGDGQINFLNPTITNTSGFAVEADFFDGVSVFTGGTITDTGGTGLDLNNVDGTFNFNSFVNITNSTGTGVNIGASSDGVFNFGNTNITNSAGTAFNVNNNSADVSFNGSITQGNAATTVAVTDHTDGTITFEVGSTITATNGDGLQFSNADSPSSYNFLGTTMLNGGDAGIDIINDSEGTFIFSASTSIISPTGTAFNVNGSSANVIYYGDIAQANNATTVAITDHTLRTITFQNGTIIATNGDGLQFSNADSNNSYYFLGTTTLNGGDAGIDIINDSEGTFTFSTGTSITSPTGTAFNLNGGTANVTYSGTITQANNATTIAIANHDNNVGNTGGMILFDADSVIQATNGDGLQFNMADANLTYIFDGTTTLNGGDAGIDILNSDGTFTFSQDTSITDPTGTAFNVDGGLPTVTYNGDIDNDSAQIIRVANTVGGSVNFSNGEYTDTGGSGIFITAAGGDVNFDNTTLTEITNSTAEGIRIDGASTGEFTFFNTTITNPTNSGVSITASPGATTVFNNLDVTTTNTVGFLTNNAGTVQVLGMGNNIITTGAAAVRLDTTTVGMTFDDISSTNSVDEGLEFDNVSGSFTVMGMNTTTVNTTGGGAAGIDINNSDAIFIFQMVDITDTAGAGIIATNSENLSVLGGTIVNPGTHGGIVIQNGVNAATFDIQNMVIDFAAINNMNGIEISSGETTATIVNNTIDLNNTTGATGIDLTATADVFDLDDDVSIDNTVINDGGAGSMDFNATEAGGAFDGDIEVNNVVITPP